MKSMSFRMLLILLALLVFLPSGLVIAPSAFSPLLPEESPGAVSLPPSPSTVPQPSGKVPRPSASFYPITPVMPSEAMDAEDYSAEGKYIAITFDDGPSKYTPQILDILDKYNAHATFFVLGNRVEDYKSSIIRMTAGGHEIANHTYSHKNLVKISDDAMRDELLDTREAISRYAPSPVLMRPPEGAWNSRVTSFCEENDFSIIYWSVDPQDYLYNGAAAVSDYVLSRAKPGDIVLLHDIFGTTVDAAETIIRTLTEQGYVFVTVSRLLELGGTEPRSGTVYWRVKADSFTVTEPKQVEFTVPEGISLN